MKKIIALILVLMTVLSMNVIVLGTSAAGEATDVTLPDGTKFAFETKTDAWFEENGYTAITTEAELKGIQRGGKYYLKNDITLTKSYSAISYNCYVNTSTGKCATSDHTGDYNCQIILHGNGKTIDIGAYNGNVFSTLPQGCEITNLKVVGSIVNAGTDTAGLAFKSNGGTFKNIISSVNLSHTEAVLTGAAVEKRISGIVGGVWRSGIYFENCVFNGSINVNTKGTGIAGICGINTTGVATFINCLNAGNINNVAATASGYTAGIVGQDSIAGCTITNCKNTGNVTSGYRASGIVGYPSKSVTITNCKNTGAITGGSNAAGIVNYIAGSVNVISGCVNEGAVIGVGPVGGIVAYTKTAATIDNCTNSGAVTGTTYVGGIAGQTYYSEITECINTADITASNFAGGITGGLYATMDSTDKTKWASGSIEYCYNTGDVISTTARCAAGISGYLSNGPVIRYNVCKADIKQLATKDNATGTDPVGASALVGYAANNYPTITNNFFMGTLSAATTQNTFASLYGPVVLAENEEVYYPNVGGNYFYFTDGNAPKYDFAAIGADNTDITEGVEPIVVIQSAELASADIVTLEQIAGGYVAYGLTDETGYWGQTINTDKYPTLGGAAVKKAEGAEVYYNDGFSGNLTLKDDLTLNAWANASVLDASELTVKFTMNGETTDAIAASVADKYYAKAAFTDIAPQYIGEEIEVALYLGETELTSDTISIVEYLEKIVELDDEKNTDIAKALLRYGYEARAYVIAKNIAAEADVAEIKSDLLDTTALAAPTGVAALVHEKNPDYDGTFCFYSANVFFDNANSIRLTAYIPEAKAATAKVVIDGEEVELVKVSDGVYEASTADIYAKVFGKHITAILYDGETVVGTLKYSIDNYAERIAASTTASAEMKALALATYYYGAAAAAYAG